MISLPNNYTEFLIFKKDNDINCDGVAHITASYFLNGGDLIELAKEWLKIVKNNQDLFDLHKGTKAENIWDDADNMERKLNVIIFPLDIQIRYQPTKENSLLVDLKGNLDEGKVVNLTIIIKDTLKEFGHVITICKDESNYLLHDPNLRRFLVWTPEDIKNFCNSGIFLSQDYLIAYDNRFPFEVVGKI